MDWQTLVPPVVAAGAALLGVRYGAKATESRESLNWTRDQRLKAYADVLEAVDRCYAAFRLVDASLDLAGYKATPELLTKVKSTLAEWGRWDEKIDEVLPRAELVASQQFQIYLSIGVGFGMRTRHRVLLMQLTHTKEVNEQEWRSIAGMTVEDLERLRRGLRADLTARETTPSRLSRLRAEAQLWRRRLQRRHASRRSVADSVNGHDGPPQSEGDNRATSRLTDAG